MKTHSLAEPDPYTKSGESGSARRETQTWRKGAELTGEGLEMRREGGSDSHLGPYIEAGTCLLLGQLLTAKQTSTQSFLAPFVLPVHYL